MANFCTLCGTPLLIGSTSAFCSQHGGPPLAPDATTKCPYCAEVIAAAAKKCKHCGEFLDSTLRQARTPIPVPQQPKWNPGTAAVLSLVIPGTGQMYKGRILAGLVWLVGVCVGYVAFVVPGVILHIACVYNAYSYDPIKAKDAKPLAPEQRRDSYNKQRSVLHKAGRVWSDMSARTASGDVAHPSVFCFPCGKYTTSRTGLCNRCGKPLA
jgi:TM2 domain-containing membrane protein YozV